MGLDSQKHDQIGVPLAATSLVFGMRGAGSLCLRKNTKEAMVGTVCEKHDQVSHVCLPHTATSDVSHEGCRLILREGKHQRDHGRHCTTHFDLATFYTKETSCETGQFSGQLSPLITSHRDFFNDFFKVPCSF